MMQMCCWARAAMTAGGPTAGHPPRPSLGAGTSRVRMGVCRNTCAIWHHQLVLHHSQRMYIFQHVHTACVRITTITVIE